MAATATTADSLTVSKDVRDTYVIDVQTLEAVDAQFQALAAQGQSIEATIFMEGGAELKGTSLVALAANPLLTQFPMEGFSIDSKGSSGIYGLRIANVANWLKLYSEDTMGAAASSAGINQILKNSRAWYRPIYRFDGELFAFAGWSALFFWCMLQAFEIRDPNWLWGVACLPAYVVVAATRKFLFRQNEFKVGIAGKRADIRSKVRAVIGGGILLAFAVGLGTNWVSGSLFG